MKFPLRLLFLAFILFQFPSLSQAQILKRTLNKLGQRVVEKKVEKEVDKKIDEVADSIVRAMDGEEPMTAEERKEADENRRRAGQLIGGMMGGINSYELPPSYDFEYRIMMEMEDEKGRITSMTTYLTDGSIIGYETGEADSKKGEDAFVVMDFDKEYMATFTKEKDQNVAMSIPIPMDMISSMAASEIEKQQESDDYSIQKTGNTKTINGYKCTEYITEDDEYIQHIWLTKEVDVNTGFYALLSKMVDKKQQVANPMVNEGYPILIEMIKKKNDKKSYVRTKEIKEGSFPFQASEYSYAY